MEHVAEQLRQIAAVVDPSEWGSVCIQDGSSVRVSLVRDAPGGPGPRFRTRFSGSRAWSARRHGAGPRWARPQATPAQHVDVRRAAGVATAAGVDARQPAQQPAPRTAPTARKRRWLITAFTRSWSARRIQTVYRRRRALMRAATAIVTAARGFLRRAQLQTARRSVTAPLHEEVQTEAPRAVSFSPAPPQPQPDPVVAPVPFTERLCPCCNPGRPGLVCAASKGDSNQVCWLLRVSGGVTRATLEAAIAAARLRLRSGQTDPRLRPWKILPFLKDVKARFDKARVVHSPPPTPETPTAKRRRRRANRSSRAHDKHKQGGSGVGPPSSSSSSSTASG